MGYTVFFVCLSAHFFWDIHFRARVNLSRVKSEECESEPEQSEQSEEARVRGRARVNLSRVKRRECERARVGKKRMPE